MTERTQRLLERSKLERSKRDQWAGLLDECYEFAFPQVERFFSQKSEGQQRVDRLFDMTAPDALNNFASRMMRDVMPMDARWFEFTAGPEIPEGQRAPLNRRLAEVADYVFADVANSDFYAEATETMRNVGISTGALLVEEGDALEPIRWTAYPLSQIYLGVGPHGQYDWIELPKKVKAGNILKVWPQARLPGELQEKARTKPNEEIAFRCITSRDWSRKTEAWTYAVLTEEEPEIIYEFTWEGPGSCPWILPGFSRGAGETYARGPVMYALPAIKTVNVMTELELEAMDWDLTPMFQAEDDGTLNVETITLAPGNIIPKAQGSKGLEPIQTKGVSRNAYVKIEDLRQSIRRALLDDDLGPVKGTPMSATEAMIRNTDRAVRLGGPYARLWTEFASKVVQRVIWIRKRRGDIRLPEVNGREIVLRPLSPLTRAQRQDDVLRFQNFMGLINQAFGPQVANIATDPMKAAAWLSEVMAINPGIVRSKVEMQAMLEQVAQLAAQAAPAAPADTGAQ